MLGYDQSTRADGIYTFTTYSHFGNGNAAGAPPLYYCGLNTWSDEKDCINGLAGNNVVSLVLATPSPGDRSFPVGQQQAYGQYTALAYNYNHYAAGIPVGFPMPIKLPPIFQDDLAKTINIFQRQAMAPDKIVPMLPSNV